jgi:hypothetical protein
MNKNKKSTFSHHINEHSTALPFYEKTLEIKKQSLPSTYPRFVTTYNNMSDVYHKMSKYSKGRLLPSNHTNIREYRSNLNDVKNIVHQKTLKRHCKHVKDREKCDFSIAIWFETQGQFKEPNTVFDQTITS